MSDDPYQVVDELTAVEDVFEIFEEGILLGSQGVIVQSVSKGVEDYLELPLAKGKWIDEIEAQNGRINAVVSPNINAKIGDIITTNINGIDVNLYVTGILNEITAVYGFRGTAVPSTCEMFFNMTDYSDESQSGTIIISSENSIFEGAKSFSSKIIIFGEGISPLNYKNNIEILGQSGLVFSLDDIFRDTKQMKQEYLFAFLPQIIILSVLSFLSLVCIGIITSLKSKKMFDIIIMCGGKVYDIFAAHLIYYFSLYIFVLAIYLITAVAFVNPSLHKTGYQTPVRVYICVELGMFIVLALIGLISSLKIRGKYEKDID
jgi:hypothetical protein